MKIDKLYKLFALSLIALAISACGAQKNTLKLADGAGVEVFSTNGQSLMKAYFSEMNGSTGVHINYADLRNTGSVTQGAVASTTPAGSQAIPMNIIFQTGKSGPVKIALNIPTNSLFVDASNPGPYNNLNPVLQNVQVRDITGVEIYIGNQLVSNSFQQI